MHYLLLPLLTALFAATFLFGGDALIVSLILLWIIAIPMDEIVGDQWSKIEARHPRLWMAVLYAQLPTLIVATLLFAYYLSDWTFLGTVINEARDRTGVLPMLAATFVLGLFYGIAGINVAHELVHRNNRAAQLVGRWLLSFSLDTGFAIEHVYGHHLHVGTERDPATAPRGMNFWVFFPRMLWVGNRNAWRIEKRFLERRGRSVFGLHNRFLTGQLMSLVWVALFAAAAGIEGVAVFVFLAFWGKIYLEMTNYIEHYGLVRVDGTRVEARHSWNSSRRITNWLLFNLPRHSDHHVRPSRNYWELEARKDAPQLPYGYFIMAVMALVPGLFRKVMDPLLEQWDRDHATPGERALVVAAHGGAEGGAMAGMPSSAKTAPIPVTRSRTGLGA